MKEKRIRVFKIKEKVDCTMKISGGQQQGGDSTQQQLSHSGLLALCPPSIRHRLSAINTSPTRDCFHPEKTRNLLGKCDHQGKSYFALNLITVNDLISRACADAGVCARSGLQVTCTSSCTLLFLYTATNK